MTQLHGINPKDVRDDTLLTIDIPAVEKKIKQITHKNTPSGLLSERMTWRALFLVLVAILAGITPVAGARPYANIPSSNAGPLIPSSKTGPLIPRPNLPLTLSLPAHKSALVSYATDAIPPVLSIPKRISLSLQNLAHNYLGISVQYNPYFTSAPLITDEVRIITKDIVSSLADMEAFIMKETPHLLDHMNYLSIDSVLTNLFYGNVKLQNIPAGEPYDPETERETERVNVQRKRANKYHDLRMAERELDRLQEGIEKLHASQRAHKETTIEHQTITIERYKREIEQLENQERSLAIERTRVTDPTQMVNDIRAIANNHITSVTVTIVYSKSETSSLIGGNTDVQKAIECVVLQYTKDGILYYIIVGKDDINDYLRPLAYRFLVPTQTIEELENIIQIYRPKISEVGLSHPSVIRSMTGVTKAVGMAYKNILTLYGRITQSEIMEKEREVLTYLSGAPERDAVVRSSAAIVYELRAKALATASMSSLSLSEYAARTLVSVQQAKLALDNKVADDTYWETQLTVARNRISEAITGSIHKVVNATSLVAEGTTAIASGVAQFYAGLGRTVDVLGKTLGDVINTHFFFIFSGYALIDLLLEIQNKNGIGSALWGSYGMTVKPIARAGVVSLIPVFTAGLGLSSHDSGIHYALLSAAAYLLFFKRDALRKDYWVGTAPASASASAVSPAVPASAPAAVPAAGSVDAMGEVRRNAATRG